jgi:hypothetical protein
MLAVRNPGVSSTPDDHDPIPSLAHVCAVARPVRHVGERDARDERDARAERDERAHVEPQGEGS